MTVRELLARLRDTDPDFLIVIGADARSLMIVNPRPGFYHPMETEEDEISRLTEQDQQFLRALHIK